MKTFVKNAVAGLFFSVLFLLVMSAPVQAQVLAHSGEIAGKVGYIHESNDVIPASVVPENHAIYAINGGYNVTPHITAMGEWAYGPLGTFSSDALKAQIIGGGARFNLMPDKKIVPYGLFTAGHNTIALCASGECVSFGGHYIAVGGGASYFVGKHWGVRPEVRYLRNEFNIESTSQTVNTVAVTGGVFYQFGGTGTAKKKK